MAQEKVFTTPDGETVTREQWADIMNSYRYHHKELKATYPGQNVWDEALDAACEDAGFSSEDLWPLWILGDVYFKVNPTQAQLLAAIKRNPWAIKYMEHPNETVQLAAVNDNPNTIGEIANATEKVQLAAIACEPALIQDIQHPSPNLWTNEEVKQAVIRRCLIWVKDRDRYHSSKGFTLATSLKNMGCPWPEIKIILRKGPQPAP